MLKFEDRVTEVLRCELCHTVTDKLVRTLNMMEANPKTDADISLLIGTSSSRPQKHTYCDCCKLLTLTTTIAWKGVYEKR